MKTLTKWVSWHWALSLSCMPYWLTKNTHDDSLRESLSERGLARRGFSSSIFVESFDLRTHRYNQVQREIARRRCKSAEVIENRPLMLATAS